MYLRFQFAARGLNSLQALHKQSSEPMGLCKSLLNTLNSARRYNPILPGNTLQCWHFFYSNPATRARGYRSRIVPAGGGTGCLPNRYFRVGGDPPTSLASSERNRKEPHLQAFFQLVASFNRSV